MFANPALSSRLDSAVAWIVVPAGHMTFVPGVLVHVSSVAEAEPAPTNAITAAAATTARPSVFRYFISFSLSRRRSAIFLLSPGRRLPIRVFPSAEGERREVYHEIGE